MPVTLDILYEDADIIIVQKPEAMLVHRSTSTSRQEPALLQILRDQVGHRVYPVHRLDRATSGLVLLAKHEPAAAQLSAAWRQGLVRKLYLAVVRGWAPSYQWIDKPLLELEKIAPKEQAAQTEVLCLQHWEYPFPIRPFATARYSLLLLEAYTGRRHQLRRHLKSMSHPILGDSQYGQGDHNRFFREHLALPGLFLHHFALEFPHPRFGQRQSCYAKLPEKWTTLLAAWTPSSGLPPIQRIREADFLAKPLKSFNILAES